MDGYSLEEKRAFAIKDNIADGEWDKELLGNKWSDLPLDDWGLLGQWKLDDKYSQNIGKVVYEPNKSNHKASDLYQAEHKFDEEINNLKNEEIKHLLKARVSYFGNFDFAKIADYYAYQATPEEQRLFEKLGLVLLDKDKLIENGFSKIMSYLDKDHEE